MKHVWERRCLYAGELLVLVLVVLGLCYWLYSLGVAFTHILAIAAVQCIIVILFGIVATHQVLLKGKNTLCEPSHMGIFIALIGLFAGTSGFYKYFQDYRTHLGLNPRFTIGIRAWGCTAKLKIRELSYKDAAGEWHNVSSSTLSETRNWEGKLWEDVRSEQNMGIPSRFEAEDDALVLQDCGATLKLKALAPGTDIREAILEADVVLVARDANREADLPSKKNESKKANYPSRRKNRFVDYPSCQLCFFVDKQLSRSVSELYTCLEFCFADYGMTKQRIPAMQTDDLGGLYWMRNRKNGSRKDIFNADREDRYNEIAKKVLDGNITKAKSENITESYRTWRSIKRGVPVRLSVSVIGGEMTARMVNIKTNYAPILYKGMLLRPFASGN